MRTGLTRTSTVSRSPCRAAELAHSAESAEPETVGASSSAGPRWRENLRGIGLADCPHAALRGDQAHPVGLIVFFQDRPSQVTSAVNLPVTPTRRGAVPQDGCLAEPGRAASEAAVAMGNLLIGGPPPCRRPSSRREAARERLVQIHVVGRADGPRPDSDACGAAVSVEGREAGPDPAYRLRHRTHQ